MSEENGQLESDVGADADLGANAEPEPPLERDPLPPIESRFLYVDVAAQRAKQLRRGALPRLKDLAPDPETGVRPDPQSKLERIAMREVDGGLVLYEVPEPKRARGTGA